MPENPTALNVHQPPGQKPLDPGDWRISVAPMMDWTDRHCRFFHRLLSPHARLYTEMVTSAALVRGRQLRLLEHSHEEHPVALQLGGSEAAELAEAARLGAAAGYDEINLNVGCPSDRVQSGRFGACLMYEPALVAECVKAMRDAVSVPVTVKCRIGVDEQDDYADLQHFTETMLEAGVEVLVVHARKAWLKGLSPKENREIPPLDYGRVYRLAARLPVPVLLNGGIKSLHEAEDHLASVSGVMLGRLAYHEPMRLAAVDGRFFGEAAPSVELRPVVEAMAAYAERELARGARLNAITRHMLGLAAARPGARTFRQILSVDAARRGAGPEILLRALDALEPDLQLAV